MAFYVNDAALEEDVVDKRYATILSHISQSIGHGCKEDFERRLMAVAKKYGIEEHWQIWYARALEYIDRCNKTREGAAARLERGGRRLWNAKTRQWEPSRKGR